MANIYGLVTDTYKYGTGSLYAPYNTSLAKRFRINPAIGDNFSIGAGEDFYISAWIKYGSLNVSQLGQQYPIIQYGDNTTGWSIGLRIERTNDAYSALPYFQFNGSRLTSDFNGENGTLISPSTRFDSYVMFRSNGIIYFQFNNGNSVNQYGWGPNSTFTQVAYNGSIGTTSTASTNSITLGSTQPVITSANATNGAWIDELFFIRGQSSPTIIKPNGEIGDGGNANTVFLYHFNGDYTDDVGIRNASANLVSTASCSGTLINSIYTPANAKFTITANAKKIARISATTKTTLRSSATLSSTPRVLLGSEWPSNYRSLFHLDGSGYDSVTKTNPVTFGHGWQAGTVTYANNPLTGFGQRATGTGPYIQLETFNPTVYTVGRWDPFYIDLKVQVTADSGSWTSHRLIHYTSQSVIVDGTEWHFALHLVLNDNQTGTKTDYLLWQLTRNPIGLGNGTIGVSAFSTGTSARLFARPSSQNFFETQRDVSLRYTGTTTDTATIWLDDLSVVTPNSAVYSSRNNTSLLVGAQPSYDGSGIGTSNTIAIDEIRLQVTGTYYDAPNTVPYKKITNSIIDIDADFTVVASVRRARLAEADLSVDSSLVAVNKRLRASPTTLTARATVTARIDDRLRSQTANLTARATLTANVRDRNPARATLQSTATVGAVVKRLTTPPAYLTATSTQTSVARKTASARANLQVLASELTLDTAVKRARAILSSQATISADVIKDTSSYAQLSSNSTMLSNATAIKSAVENVTSTATQTSRPIKKAQAQANFTVLASELIYGNYFVTSDSAYLSSSFVLECDPLKLAYNRTRLTAVATLDVNPTYIASADSEYQSDTSLYANGGKIRFGVAYLQAFAFEVTIGSKVSIDPYLMLAIDPETRLYKIYSEDRVFSIDSETRGLVIARESRELEVKPENGLNIIQG